MPGVRTRIRGNPRAIRVAESPNSTEPQITDSDDRSRSVQAFPINRHHSFNAINCSKAFEVSAMGWILGIVGPGTVEKAVGLLDTLGTSVANLKLGSYLSSTISILAFEVAKVILKGHRIKRSISGENIRHLKKSVLESKGVRTLVSQDSNELLRITAADKGEELESFLREVVHFGKFCKDAQWRYLDRYFEKLGRGLNKETSIIADSTMEQLMTLVDYTANLFSELCTLDKLEKEFHAKSQQGNFSTAVQRGVGDFANLRAEIKSQRKIVRSLKKKSLWCKSFEEIVEKLVHVGQFLLATMNQAFGSAGDYKTIASSMSNRKNLGPMALHYATIIIQIDTLGTLSGSAPPSMRDDLYQRLPRGMKSALREKLQSIPDNLKCDQVKAEMDKILHWLVPIARNTTKALQGLGWSRGWANIKSEVDHELTGHTHALRIETLYHADREETEACILELVTWLHLLVVRARRDVASEAASSSSHRYTSVKGQDILENVRQKILNYGVSRSQNFAASKPGLSKTLRLAKSGRESQGTENRLGWSSWDPVIDFDIHRLKVLDVIDGLERA